MQISADDSYFIIGIVTVEDSGLPIGYYELGFTYERTNETIYKMTNENGSYVCPLADFESGWQFGDYIQINAMDMTAYYVCHAEIYLSNAIVGFTYPMPLVGALIPNPIPVGGNGVAHIGTMNCVNHYSSDSQLAFTFPNGGKLTFPWYCTGIKIYATNCFSDDGSYVSGTQSYSIYWSFESRINGSGDWPEDLWDTEKDYIMEGSSDYESGNPPNPCESWTRAELGEPPENLDFRFKIHCQGSDSTLWEKEKELLNIKIEFTGQ